MIKLDWRMYDWVDKTAKPGDLIQRFSDENERLQVTYIRDQLGCWKLQMPGSKWFTSWGVPLSSVLVESAHASTYLLEDLEVLAFLTSNNPAPTGEEENEIRKS